MLDEVGNAKEFALYQVGIGEDASFSADLEPGAGRFQFEPAACVESGFGDTVVS